MVSFASSLEPLRLANSAAGQILYEWALASDDGHQVRSSCHSLLNVDHDLLTLSHRDIIVVCGGANVSLSSTKRIINWLRRESLKGGIIVGLHTGAYAMAKAGLLNNRQATIHRERRDSFAEEFPEVELCRSSYVVDGKRMTSIGGVSSVEPVLHVITEDHGESFAAKVAQELDDCPRPDPSTDTQSSHLRTGIRHPKLASVVRTMEENIEEPISTLILARDEGLSLRQLERLFRRHLNYSPKRYYMEIRLQRARNLLIQTDMTVLDIAIACGFGSPSHFSKCYRLRYNTSPYRERWGQSGSKPSGTIPIGASPVFG